jgi:endonuclease YncB( thermonuclease family)
VRIRSLASQFHEFVQAMPFLSKTKTSVTWAIVFALVSSWLAVGNAQATSIISGTAKVTDGDTIKISGTKIRIHGIDAPEGKQTCKLPDKIIRCGAIATDAMKKLVKGITVTCQQTDTDRYGRTIAICRANGVDIGQRLVQTGWAIAYRRYSTRYVVDEDAARAGKLGMWKGEFVKPWEWRRGVRLSSNKQKLSTTGCKIKGNISKSGRIYHVPESRWYDQTKIDEGSGEKWFCKVEDAEQAGWRPPT